MSTCTEPDCDQPRLVTPDNVALSTRWSAGREFVCVDTKPNGRTETAWCREHFPSWLWGTHRVPRAPKPHIPATDYGVISERMRAGWASVTEAAVAGAAAARHITESAGSLTEAYQQYVEAYGGEPS